MCWPYFCDGGDQLIIEKSYDIAQKYSKGVVGTEHILLSLLEEKSSVAAKILSNMGKEPAKIREQALNVIKIKERELACYAPFDNVKSVEYKTNQTFTFERHSAVSDTKLYEETVTGLDSITVYFNSESISLAGTLTDQMFKNMKMGQAFDILQKSDVDAMLEANSSISGIEGMEEMGTCEVSLTPKNLEYKNSYITIYFDPATCTPVATVHNLHYVVTMNMFMNIDISAKNLAGDSLALEALLTLLTLKNKGKLLDVHGTMDISNEMNTRSVVYFTDNNINHIPY